MTTHLTRILRMGRVIVHSSMFYWVKGQICIQWTVRIQHSWQPKPRKSVYSTVKPLKTAGQSFKQQSQVWLECMQEWPSLDLVQQCWQYSVIQVVYQNTRLQLIQCKCSLCDLIVSIKLIYIRIHNCFHNLPTGNITGLLRFDDTRSSAMLTCTVKLWLQMSIILEGCSGQFRWTVKDWLRLSWWYSELHVHSIGTISSPPAEYEAFAQNCRLVWLLMLLLTWWRSKKGCLWVATVM